MTGVTNMLGVVNVLTASFSGTGSLDGETSGACSGNTIKVKIIDA